jgi:membrane peptidoglycan carboxypeptidase
MSPSEAATLAAMIASPRLFQPGHPSRRLQRRTSRILRWLARPPER